MNTPLDVPTAPSTPVKATPSCSTAMGGGDRALTRKSDSLRSATTSRCTSSIFIRGGSPSIRRPRPLHLASPPPKPLWMYDSPSRMRRATQAEQQDLRRLEGSEYSPVRIGLDFLAEALELESATAYGTNDSLRTLHSRDDLAPISLGSPFQDQEEVSPELLGQNSAGLDALENIPSASFRPIDSSFFSRCKLSKFDPNRPVITSFDILFRFGGLFAEGITMTEFKKIFRQCSTCDNLLYGDRRTHHQCDGAALDLEAENFDLVQALLSGEQNQGLTTTDFRKLTVTCGDCNRLCLATSGDFHECTRYPQRPIARFRQ